jgi:phosphopantothenoylcysteine synthetase/decarboxylase
LQTSRQTEKKKQSPSKSASFPRVSSLVSTPWNATLPPVNVLLTAGPTHEPIDPVRYLTNRSSGKMGYELAAAFAACGHRVLLVSGPTNLDVPEGVDFFPVRTAAEMHHAVGNYILRSEIAIFAAAVADYTPASIASHKIKKTSDTIHLELRRTPDILGSARQPFGFSGTLVGFAAETENLELNARNKLERKGCDLIIANDVSQPGIGFESDHNAVTLVYPDRIEPLPRVTKHELAHQLLHVILELHQVKHASP